MDDQQLNKIQNKVHPEVIASKEFNRNWSHKIRYDWHKYSGLELQDYRFRAEN